MTWRMQKSMTGVSCNEFSDLSLSYWEDGQGNGMVRSHSEQVFVNNTRRARAFFNKRIRSWHKSQGRPPCGLITGKEAWAKSWPSASTRKPSQKRATR